MEKWKHLGYTFLLPTGFDETAESIPLRCLLPTHQDSHASAYVYLQKGNYTCDGCDFKTQDFFQTFGYFFKLHPDDVQPFLQSLISSKPVADCYGNLDVAALVKTYRFTTDVIKQVGLLRQDTPRCAFSVPVMWQNRKVGLDSYYPNETVKWKAAPGTHAGWVVPFDLAQTKTDYVVVCAGAKDMLVARSHGLNAFYITGGENTLPRFAAKWFSAYKGAVVLYDNDETGRRGAAKLATWLIKEAKVPKVIVNTCLDPQMQPKEDLWDFFVKYKHNVRDLFQILQSTERFQPPKQAVNEVEDLDSLHKYVSHNDTLSKPVTIPLLVRYFTNQKFMVYTKAYLVDDTTHERVGKAWCLNTQRSPTHLVYLLRQPKERNAWLKSWLLMYNKMGNSRNVKLKHSVRIDYGKSLTIYKYGLIDVQGTKRTEPSDITAYTQAPMLRGGSYFVTCYVVTNEFAKPNHVQELVVTDFTEKDNHHTAFTLTPDKKRQLAAFSNLSHNDLYQHFQTYAGNYVSELTWLTIDLTFHSVFEIPYGPDTIRGVVHTLMVGDTRTGKSTPVALAIKFYGVGVIQNCATTTIAALVGGSARNSDHSWYTLPGLLPINHKGLVCLEEVQVKKEYYRYTQDIKSRGTVTIGRVRDPLEVACRLRLIEIANPGKKRGWGDATMEDFNNGPQVVMSVIENVASIAREDIMFLQTKSKWVNPDYKPPLNQALLSQEHYQTRLHWTLSRKPEDIVLTPEAEDLLLLKNEELYRKYETPAFPIVTQENHQRLTRLSIAYAAMRVSTDEHFQKVIVRQEHVARVVEFFLNLYVYHRSFKLKEFVEQERKYRVFDENKDAESFFDFYEKCTDDNDNIAPSFINYLRETDEPTNGTELSRASGLAHYKFPEALNILYHNHYLRFKQNKYHVTAKCRKALEWWETTGQERWNKERKTSWEQSQKAKMAATSSAKGSQWQQ